MEATYDKVPERVLADREFFDGLGKIYPADMSVQIRQDKFQNIVTYWFEPNKGVENEIILYLHGGSFALGSLNSHKSMLSHFASKLNRKILFVDYSLAPEKPYPQGINDVLAVYKAIRQKFPNSKIIIMGDSAGGGLAVSVIGNMSIENQPNGVVLISPWINLRCNTASYETRKKLDPILTREDLLVYAAYYVNKKLNEADPSLLTFRTFPPLLIAVGSNEVLFDDSKNFYEVISAVQPLTQLKEYEKQTHVWPLTDIQSDGTRKLLKDIGTFLNEKTTL